MERSIIVLLKHLGANKIAKASRSGKCKKGIVDVKFTKAMPNLFVELNVIAAYFLLFSFKKSKVLRCTICALTASAGIIILSC